ncbi:MAG: TRAP transporter small permease [Pseudomonadota bacterium]|nr:TRAP transporter small permease [Pseudomonadota bacterium]
MFIAIATLTDVIGRLIGVPLKGAFEMVQISMIFVIFAALPSLTLAREHVSVDLLTSFVPASVQRILLTLVDLIGTGVCIFYAVRLWARGNYLERIGEVTSNLQVPLFPFVFFMSVMWAATAVAFVMMIIDDLRGLSTQEETN